MHRALTGAESFRRRLPPVRLRAKGGPRRRPAV